MVLNLYQIALLVFIDVGCLLPFSLAACGYIERTLGLRWGRRLSATVFYLENLVCALLVQLFGDIYGGGPFLFLLSLCNLFLLVWLLGKGSVTGKVLFWALGYLLESVAYFALMPPLALLTGLARGYLGGAQWLSALLDGATAAAVFFAACLLLRQVSRRGGGLRAGIPAALSWRLLVPLLSINLGLLLYYGASFPYPGGPLPGLGALLPVLGEFLVRYFILLALILLGVYGALILVFGVNGAMSQALLSQQLGLQRAYFADLERQYHSVDAVRKDQKARILKLLNMLSRKNIVAAKDYLLALSDEADALDRAISTGNEVADALLGDKYRSAQQAGAEFLCQVKLPRSDRVDAFDLCILLGNAVDLALEALGKVDNPYAKKFIHVRTGVSKAYLLFEVSGSTGTPHGFGKGLAPEQEADPLHGTEYENIRAIVEKYEGVLERTVKEGVFTLSFMISIR